MGALAGHAQRGVGRTAAESSAPAAEEGLAAVQAQSHEDAAAPLRPTAGADHRSDAVVNDRPPSAHLLELIAQPALAEQGERPTGLVPGNPKTKTAHPNADRRQSSLGYLPRLTCIERVQSGPESQKLVESFPESDK